MNTIKILATRRDGTTQLLDIPTPITFSEVDNPRCSMWQMHDAAGTDYFFNKDDGTYDGWGRAAMCQEEVPALLDCARKKTPPKIEVN